MISIVISTHNPEFLKKVFANITESIGCKFEVIPVENPNKYSIAQAYNIGANKAQYQYLCFVHEDVMFQTKNWGQILINSMIENEKLGLIGVVGAKLITQYSLGWTSFNFLHKLLYSGHINQGHNSWTQYRYDNFSPLTKGLSNVVSVDGVLLFTKKEIWGKNKFDEKLIKGFHGYDLDFSLQLISKGWKIMTTKDILLYHYSTGKINKDWVNTNISILKKFKKNLPCQTENLKLNKVTIWLIKILIYIKYIFYKIKK